MRDQFIGLKRQGPDNFRGEAQSVSSPESDGLAGSAQGFAESRSSVPSIWRHFEKVIHQLDPGSKK